MTTPNADHTADIGSADTAYGGPTAGSRRGGRQLARGEQIDHFVVLDVLGEGGMGVVYSAYDPTLDRKVAIKLLRSSAGGPDATSGRRRLLREAQALARFHHEHVVVVHAAGEVDGEVYVAMEQVAGGTLRSWLRAGDRSWREIVDLFRKAGAGLAAAHHEGLVHRDFKPENVLVGDDGRVRVTDFGLVSSTTGEAVAVTFESGDEIETFTGATQLTRHGEVVGTPGYVAPEVLHGARADDRADQFAFCVSLYEALHGVKPFRGESPDEARAALLAGAIAERPQGTDVPPWLDQLVERGLAADPAARYDSLDQLLRELARDPIAARRRRLRVAGGLIGVAAVAAAAAVVLTRTAVHAAGPCDAAGDRVDEVWNGDHRAGLIAAFAATSAPYRAAVAGHVAGDLDRYAGDLRSMRVDACRSNKVRGEQSDAVFDARMACLDRKLAYLGAHVDVLTHGVDDGVVERAGQATAELPDVAECADLRAVTELVARPDRPELRGEVDRLDQVIAEVRAKLNTGRAASAGAEVDDMVERARAIGWPHSLARALELRGERAVELEDHAVAEQSFVEALPLAAESRDDAEVATIGLLLMQERGVGLNQPARALAMQPVVLAAVARAGGSPRLESQLERSLGAIHDAAGDYDEALRHYQRAYELASAGYGPDHPRTVAALNDVAVVHDLQGRRKQALALYQQVLELERKHHGEDHPRVARALNNMAIVIQEDDPKRALGLFDRAVDIYRAAYGDGHSMVAITELNRGVVLQMLDRFDDAARAYRLAADIWRDAEGVGQRYRATALANIGDIYERQGECRQALAEYERARDVLVAAGGDQHPDLGYPLLGIGSCRVALGDAVAAVEPLERALGLLTAQDVDPTEIAKVELALSRALWASGRDRTRARALALKARGAYTDAGDTTSDERHQLDAWTAERRWQ